MWWPALLAGVVASVTGLCVACQGSVWLARVVCRPEDIIPNNLLIILFSYASN